MGLTEAVFDNPILVKHLRSRLRTAQAVPWAIIVLVLSACIAWSGLNINWIGCASAVTLLIGLQILALGFGGSNQINSTLGGARESGILDFHRVSPVPPAVVALGFFLGAPIREYLLAAIVIPFAALNAWSTHPVEPARGLRWFAQLEVAVLVSFWVVHAVAMLSCLTRKKPRGSMIGTVVTIIVLLILGYLGSAGFYFGARYLLDEEPTLNFYGRMIPWGRWLILYELPALGFLGLAVSRKMKGDRVHALTKVQALACLATFAILLVGGLWNISRHLAPAPPFEPTSADMIMMVAVYALVLAAAVLTVTITPDAGEYLKGLRRAARDGRRRLSAWSDAGSNRLALFALCAIVLVGATTIVNVVGKQPYFGQADLQYWARQDPKIFARATIENAEWLASRQRLFSRPIAIGVLTVACFGLALQYFSLRSRWSGPSLLALFLFAAWLVPLLGGAIFGLSGPGHEASSLGILALSPVIGIGLSSGLGPPPGLQTIQLAALTPAITFAFLFNYLLVTIQRKLDRQLHALAKPSPAASPHPLEVT